MKHISLLAFASSSNPSFLRASSKQHNRANPICSLGDGGGGGVQRSISRRVTLQLISTLLVGCGTGASPVLSGDTTTTPYLYSGRKEVRLENGLRYFDLKVGEGAEAVDGSTLTLHYTSRLGGLYGIRLDGTRDGSGGGDPIKYKLGSSNAVPCFDIALQGMRVGTVRRVMCTAELGYKSADDVPVIRDFFARRRLLSVLNTVRDKTIVFDLELIRVK